MVWGASRPPSRPSPSGNGWPMDIHNRPLTCIFVSLGLALFFPARTDD